MSMTADFHNPSTAVKVRQFGKHETGFKVIKVTQPGGNELNIYFNKPGDLAEFIGNLTAAALNPDQCN